MLQLIGENVQYINIREGRERERYLKDLGIEVIVTEVTGTIRTFLVFVGDNPVQPCDAIYFVKVIDADGVGTKTEFNNYETGSRMFDVDMKPINSQRTSFMQFALYNNPNYRVKEHYECVQKSGLQYLKWSLDYIPPDAKFIGHSTRLQYVLQFNRYIDEIWSKNPSDEQDYVKMNKKAKF